MQFKLSRVIFEKGKKNINLQYFVQPKHGLLESRTGNFNITVKKEKTDALISERCDEISYFFF